MSLRSTLIFIVSEVFLGIIFLIFFRTHLYVFILLSTFAAVFLWGLGGTKQPKSIENSADLEYHNDFRRVPGGSSDIIPPKPRSYIPIDIYKEFEESLNEDLRNIGLEDFDDIEEKDKKN